jgi:hypothetical protein
MLWCITKPADSTAPKLKVSFTDADAPNGQLGLGWWLVMRDFVRTDASSGSIAELSTC